MKTETLIELQRSITQGNWACNFGNGTNLTNDVTIWGNGAVIGEIASDPSFPMIDARSEMPANATAIALVPELIAEVIRLREALNDINDIATKADTIGSVSMHPELKRMFIELSVSTDAENARAALVNDK